MFTSGGDCFILSLRVDHPDPNLAFAADAGASSAKAKFLGDDGVGLLEDFDGLCLHIMHSTSSMPRGLKLTEHELSHLAVAVETYSTSFSRLKGIFTSLFHS